MSSGVLVSILSRSRMGRSMTSARLFPCLVSFFCVALRHSDGTTM